MRKLGLREEYDLLKITELICMGLGLVSAVMSPR